MRRQIIDTKVLAVFALIFAFTEVVCQSAFFGDLLGGVSLKTCYAMFCVMPLVLFAMKPRFTVNFLLASFCAVAGVSLIFNYPIENYMSVLRFCFFCAMLCLVSPLVSSDSFRTMRRYLWESLTALLQLIVVLSLLLYLKTELIDGRGNPFLIFAHPMLLSTVSGFVAVVITARLLRGVEQRPKYVVAYDCISLIIATILLVWGGSRGAMLSFLAAEIYLCVIYSRQWKRLRIVLIMLASAIVIVVAVGGLLTHRVERKFEIASQNNSLIFSRQQLWKSRIEEFCEKPLLGIGFTNATRQSTLYDNQQVVGHAFSATDEPGSSWLSVLSNTGVVGFGILAVWTVMLFKTVRRRRREGDTIAATWGGVLLFFTVDAMFEGWLLYAGSIQFFQYWLLTSQILDRNVAGNYAGKTIKGVCRL